MPISAICTWYDYYRSQGLPFSSTPRTSCRASTSRLYRPVDCSAINAAMRLNDGDETGAYTAFWSRRDYRAAPAPSASDVTASVFVVQGLQDLNVRTVNFGRWYGAAAQPCGAKLWLSRPGHADPFDFRRSLWVDTLHRWFDHYLMGIDNGILDEPRVDVETSPGTWVTSDRWPVSDNDQTYTFHADGSMTTGAPETGTGPFVNSPAQFEAQAVAQGDNPNRLLYITGSLEKDLRISGEPTVDLTVTPQESLAQVGVALVDYGTQVRVPDDGAGNTTLGTQSCWGQSTSYDDACYFDSIEALASTPLAVLARGWARLIGNQTNTLTVDLAYNDVVVPAGHQLGLVIFGASPQWLANLDTQATPYAVDLATSSLTLPVVGAASFGPGGGDLRQVPVRLPRGTVPDPGAQQDRRP